MSYCMPHNPLYPSVPWWIRLTETKQTIADARPSRAGQHRVKNPQTGHPYAVAQIDKDTGKVLKIFENCCTAALEVGGHRSNISKCVNGQVNTSGGYRWKKVSDLKNEKEK